MSYNLIISWLNNIKNEQFFKDFKYIDKYTIFKISNKTISKFRNLFLFNKLKLQFKKSRQPWNSIFKMS